MNKKIIRTAALTTVLLMSLSGCGKQTEKSQQAPISMQNRTSQQPSVSMQEQTSQDIPQKCKPVTADGIYRIESIFPDSSNVVYIDFENRQELFLCSRPDCPHSDDSCTSYNQGLPIACTADKLVLLGTAPAHGANMRQEKLPQALYTCNLDGSERKLVYAEKQNQKMHGTDAYQQGTNLFFIEEYCDEEQEKIWQRLLKVDLSSGEETVLLEFEENTWGNLIMGGCPGGLLLMESRLEEKEWIDYIYRFDLKTQQQGEPIFTASENDRIFVQNNTVYRVQDESRITAYDMQTGEERSAEYAFLFKDIPNVYAASIYPAFDDWMMVSITTDSGEGEEPLEKDWLLNLSSGENRPFTLVDSFRGHALTPAADTGNEICVCVDYDEVDWQWDVDGEISKFTLYLPTYAMISKEDYLNSQPNYQLIQRMYETKGTSVK